VPSQNYRNYSREGIEPRANAIRTDVIPSADTAPTYRRLRGISFSNRVTLISGLDTGLIETCLDQRDVMSTKEQSWQPKSRRNNGDGIALMNERLIYGSASLRTTTKSA
jgi:hypothetical protein